LDSSQLMHWGVVKSFPFNEVKQSWSLQQWSNLLSRTQLTSHSSESSSSNGCGGSIALLGISLEVVGFSSDTWKAGWMHDSTRDRPSQNTWDNTFFTIRNAPGSDYPASLKGKCVRYPGYTFIQSQHNSNLFLFLSWHSLSKKVVIQ